jgi:hypothetical protein
MNHVFSKQVTTTHYSVKDWLETTKGLELSAYPSFYNDQDEVTTQQTDRVELENVSLFSEWDVSYRANHPT